MYKYQFRKAKIEDICKITEIADHFFESNYWENNEKGRCQYFKQLYNANNKIFYVLEYVEENETEIIGYNSIIPETREALNSHRSGILNQYSLNSKLIYGTEVNVPANTFFWQAIAIYRDHLKESKEQRDEMIAYHIADMLGNCKSRKNFQFIAERFSNGGERFMKNRGFLKTNILTATDHTLWTFDSKSPFIFATDSYLKGRKLVKRIEEILKP